MNSNSKRTHRCKENNNHLFLLAFAFPPHSDLTVCEGRMDFSVLFFIVSWAKGHCMLLVACCKGLAYAQ
eukprot:m.100791 g.100791  ORF g.100791 m.100791 type:complete len:69 (+) comp14953_c0_seq1:1552-1758(+)